MSTLVAVRLDSPMFGSGPATVIALPSGVDEYWSLVTLRDGVRDARMRLWKIDGPVPQIGDRVAAGLVSGTGKGRLTIIESPARKSELRKVVRSLKGSRK